MLAPKTGARLQCECSGLAGLHCGTASQARQPEQLGKAIAEEAEWQAGVRFVMRLEGKFVCSKSVSKN